MADDFDPSLKDFQMSKSGAMKSRLYGEEGAKAA